MNSLKAELIKKIEDTAEGLNSKIEQNKSDIRQVENVQSEHETKIDNLTVRSEQNTEDISDIKLRIDKLEKERNLNEQRFSSIEEVIDNKKEEKTPPKIKRLLNEVTKMKEDLKNVEEVREEVNKSKITAQAATSQSQHSTTIIQTHSLNTEDKYVEERGEVGISPVSVEDIREFTTDNEVSDKNLVSSFSYIYI